jgi:steroid delta-isomerase-like uncharacterized protein
MLMDDLKATVLRYIEAVWNRGDSEALDELTTAEFAYYLGGQPGLDRAGMSRFVAATRAAFPDWRVEPLDVVAEAGMVAVRWRGEVSHRGPFHGIAPTNRRVTVGGINLYRIEDGKVVTEWEQTDTLGMLRQLGALPA